MAATTEFRSKILTRGTGPDDYAIYRAGLEWDLTDPIVIESEEDFKSRPRWHERLKPYPPPGLQPHHLLPAPSGHAACRRCWPWQNHQRWPRYQ